MTIEWQPVRSSNLAAVAYDPEKKVLSVRFLNGGVYEYLEVPQEVFAGLTIAESAGTYLATNVKGKFAYRKAGDQAGKEPARDAVVQRP